MMETGIWKRCGKESSIKYIYRPYHPWRHGNRREKRMQRLRFLLRILLAGEVLVLSGRYLKAHTYYQVYQREEFEVSDDGNDFYGIGIDAEDGSLFRFHKRTETKEE